MDDIKYTDKVKLSSAYAEMINDEEIKNWIYVLKHLVVFIVAISNMEIKDKSAEFNEGFQAGFVTIGMTFADVIHELEKRLEDGIEQA